MEVIEICPYCGYENHLSRWTKKAGYKAECKNCGKVIFLCDACLHSDDNLTYRCNWKKDETEAGTCFRFK